MRNLCQGRPLDRAIYVQTQIGQSKMRNLSQRRPLGQAIYVKTQTGHSKMRYLHQRDHLKRAIYIQTQIGHLRMRNLCQGDHSTKKFTSKFKQATKKWAFTSKTQTVIHDSHKHTTTQGLQKQTHKIHANIQEYKT